MLTDAAFTWPKNSNVKNITTIKKKNFFIWIHLKKKKKKSYICL